MSEESLDLPPVVESVIAPGDGPAPGPAPAPGATVLTSVALKYLDQTRPWALFISIMTFLSAGLMLLGGGFMLAAGVVGSLAARNRGDLAPLGGAIGMGFASLMYLAVALVYVPAGVFLFRYSSAIDRLKASRTAAALEDALKFQRSFWRYVGIMTLVGIVMAIVVVVLAVVAGALAAAVTAGRS